MELKLKIKNFIFNEIAKNEWNYIFLPYIIDLKNISKNKKIVLETEGGPKNHIELAIKDIQIISKDNLLSSNFKKWKKNYPNFSAFWELFLNNYNFKKKYDKVFKIKIQNIVKIKKANILLDTNIIIDRESYVKTKSEVAEFYKLLDKLQCKKILHPITKKEILKIKDENLKNNILTKLETYYNLSPHEKETDKEFSKIISKFKVKNENDENDNMFLYSVYKEKVDFLITNDKLILNKAYELNIREKVLTTYEFLLLSKKIYPNDIDYKVLNIRLLNFSNINLNDDFFDGLKNVYGEKNFTKWFNNKSIEEEKAYVLTEDKKIKGFLYLKIEDEDEIYPDITPIFTKKKRLKIGTFKHIIEKINLGERFLKIVFDKALENNVDEIYVTFKDEKENSEIQKLKNLFIKWGFEKWGTKSSEIIEEVYIKKINASYDESKSIMKNFPVLKNNKKYFFLPIEWKYHTELFPDLILKSESLSLFKDLQSHRCSLEKIYVCNVNINFLGKKPNPGDILVIYRMGQTAPKKYSSVVTGLAILEELKELKTEDDYAKLAPKSVFDYNDLMNFYKNGKNKTLIKLIYFKSFDKKIILEDLWNTDIIKKPNGPRILDEIKVENYYKIEKYLEENYE